MNMTDRVVQRVFQSALLWGGLLSVGFYVLLGAIDERLDPWLVRALTSRWEAYLCTSLFLIGFAALTIRAVDIIFQAVLLTKPLRPESTEESTIISAEAMLEYLSKNSTSSNTYLHRRLKNALQFVTRNVAGTKSLASHLSELADADRTQMERHYDLTRFLTWALPAVGSLATVLGIATAITQLNATNSEELIKGVTVGLAQAFDTFALALGMSILLVLYKFVDTQCEQLLLAVVDRKVEEELDAQLAETVDPSTAQMEQLRMLTHSMVKATEKLAQQQQSAQFKNAMQGGATGQQAAAMDEQKMESMVARAMANALQNQPTQVAISSSGEMDMSGWKPLQQALQQVASYLARQQAKQETEGEVVQQLINIIGDEMKDDRPVRQRPELRMHDGNDTEANLWKRSA